MNTFPFERMMKSMPAYKAVIFDIGGVCVGSPFQGIAKYEREHGLPPDYINVAIVSRGENGAFQRLERGELDLYAFYDLFGKELSDPRNLEYYKEYRRLRKEKIFPDRILSDSSIIDGKELFRAMMAEASRIDPVVFSSLQKLRAGNRFKLAALTNNFFLPKDDVSLVGNIPEKLKNIFDEFIESSVVGLRKPDPRFFLYACEKLAIQPSDAVFLDDIGINLKSASELGMRTIKVELGKSRKAIKELENVLNVKLLDEDSKF
ncbi:5531_t:CDS:2 [Paraglomus brasilianum]|uniref:5531_t:CDS:1 n=1 Tax=Paraglomus brasilianum TaxID=144538 RepID=A0A9N9FBC6_9GLOM|nr:5531_t:CDS:2 [Paraglomus brasilianum]